MTAFDPKRAHPSLRRPDVVEAIANLTPTVFGECDLCAELGDTRPATCERPVGQVWRSLCDGHAHRHDLEARGRARLAAMGGAL